MGILLPALVALIPLLILPGWSFYFDVVPKVAACLAGAAAVVMFGDFPVDGFAGRSRLFLALAAIEATVLTAAAMLSRYREMSFVGSIWRREGILAELAVLVLAAAVCGALCSEPARLRPFLRITVLGSIPVSIYGIAQYFGLDPWITAAGYHVGDGKFQIVRPPSTLGHAAYFATYLIYPLFGGIELRALETGRLWKRAAWLAAMLAGFAMILSGTRAAILASLAGALFVLLREGVTAKRLLRAGGAAAVVLAMLAGFYISPAGERLRARAYWSHDDPLGGARLLLWRDTARMAGAHLVHGFGPETFVLEFPAYESVELARAYPDFYHESPHNILLDALVSSGSMGLAALASMAALGLFYARGAIGGAFVAILISQQFTAFTLPTELFFYVCLAMLAAAPARKSGAIAGRFPLRWAVAAPFAFLAIYLAVGDAALAAARRAADRGDVDAAAEDVAWARKWHATADLYFSRRLVAETFHDPVARLRAWNFAREAARRAPDSADDRMNAWVNLAAFRAGEGDTAGVERDLRAAARIAPSWYQPHWLLARVLSLEGRAGEAQTEARAAEERGAPGSAAAGGR